MSEIENAKQTLNTLTNESWNVSFYGRVGEKRDVLSAFDSTVQSSWKDENGSRAMACSSAINNAISDAMTKFANVNYYATQAIKFAEKAESERIANEQNE